jgi:tRNA(Ile)-lysidine synthase
MLLQRFQQHLKETSQHGSNKLLVTVSGGVDSVVLCDLLHKSDIDFVIAHCNFQLRAAESERDELFVRGLAEKYQKQIVVKKFDTSTYAVNEKLSIQEAARNLRYSWFNNLVFNEQLADRITTAHHADDNIETVVMNFFRGTGLKGLTGMDAQVIVYRPLLPFRKKEILDYAKKNNLAFVEDSSNASNKYTRNLFRNVLLPAVKEVFPSVEENILSNIERFNEVEQVYEQAIRAHKERLIELKGSEEHIPILKLKKTFSFRTILWEIIKEKHFTGGQVDEVIKLMDAKNGSSITSDFYRIIKNRKWLIITHRQQDEINAHYVIDPEEKNKRFFEKERLLLERTALSPDFKISTAANTACLDADKIKFPLLLRKWKQGDYFYPLGMNKKKKLSRFFIDQKLSKTDKEKVWVLEMNKKIIWVVGLRIDDRFKIEPSTKNLLKITSSMHS